MTRIAVVTGANSGIGFETCRQLLADGWQVFGVDLAVTALAPLVPIHPARLFPVACDVADEAAVAAAFESIGAAAPVIEALICSAGVLRTSPLISMPTAEFDLLFAVNTRGPWLCAKAAYPLLKAGARENSPAKIVMLASIAALRPKVGGGAYAASKAALNRLVRVMSVELGLEHFRVNAIAPATVDTPMIRNAMQGDAGSGYKPSGTSPIGRISNASDIVDVIRFLLSPAANTINGAMIPVDGGTSSAFVATGLLPATTEPAKG
ncbi:SDR family oxidoreductase [soil metagenome]